MRQLQGGENLYKYCKVYYSYAVHNVQLYSLLDFLIGLFVLDLLFFFFLFLEDDMDEPDLDLLVVYWEYEEREEERDLRGFLAFFLDDLLSDSLLDLLLDRLLDLLDLLLLLDGLLDRCTRFFAFRPASGSFRPFKPHTHTTAPAPP